MILPITAFGDPVLKKVSTNIDSDYPNLKTLIANMWETMYKANGVGLAAPQVGLPIRLFVVDSTPMYEEDETQKGIKKVFINAQILEESGQEWAYEEGCLSIPGIREDVYRKPNIKIQYLNENFEEMTEAYFDMNARVIQHEYDHIQGILFTDHLKPLRKRLLQKNLQEIGKGQVKVSYKMKFPFR